MVKGTEHRRDDKKKAQFNLKEKRQRKLDKKLSKIVKPVDLI